ncbi:MAG: hypothetical protein H6873_05780 [Hyphomicrobiaceae bacterium]|nr:hypothetical protein [Hyphomicrobiaceae bacterium]
MSGQGAIPVVDLESLRALTGWAAACADEALHLFELVAPRDGRPREAIAAARRFADGGGRDNRLRKAALDAFRAANETSQPSASAAAHAASAAAGSAFLHPLADGQQVKHILGAVAFATLALESQDATPAFAALKRAIDEAPPEVAALLAQYPPCAPVKGRLGEILAELDTRLRQPRID